VRDRLLIKESAHGSPFAKNDLPRGYYAYQKRI
jgi:hypothetical protein